MTLYDCPECGKTFNKFDVERERVRVEKPLAFALWVQACHEELWVEFEKNVWKDEVRR